MRDTLRSHAILCPAWEIMPTHVHVIVEDLPDQSLATIVRYLKGATARAFFLAFPELRADLLGGHLWTKGYYGALIVTHEQFLATLRCVRTNRQRAGLEPPVPLKPAGGSKTGLKSA